MEVEVWTTTDECWACGERTVLWYPPAVGTYAGGTWAPVGEHLAELPDCPIDRVYSDVQEREVWGNVCEACGEYYGNFYVHRNARKAALQHGGADAVRRGDVDGYDVITVDIPLSCRMCGQETVELPAELCAGCLP